MEIIKHFPKYLLPVYLGLFFIGLITLIILGPRFVLSPVLLVQEGKGVFDSAKISYKKTSGYWGKIFGNMFVAALIAIVVSVVLNMALILVPFSMVLGAIVMQAITAFMVVFVTKLSLGILQSAK